MSGLPRIVQRAPYILYGLAVVVFAASWLLALGEINVTMGYSTLDNPAVLQVKLRALYQAALEAIYIAGNGFVAHILVAIWRNGAAGSPVETVSREAAE